MNSYGSVYYFYDLRKAVFESLHSWGGDSHHPPPHPPKKILEELFHLIA